MSHHQDYDGGAGNDYRNNRKRVRDPDNNDDNDEPISNQARPKLQSAIGNISRNSRKLQRGELEPTNDFNINVSKPEIREAYQQPEVLQRSRKMFGSLMGHLGLAKKTLERDSTIIQKQNDVNKSVSKKISEESTRLMAAKSQSPRMMNSRPAKEEVSYCCSISLSLLIFKYSLYVMVSPFLSYGSCCLLFGERRNVITSQCHGGKKI